MVLQMLIFVAPYFLFMKKRVERTRAAHTMTESAFWSYIRSALRERSRWWKPIALARIKARRPYKGPLKRQRYEFQCNICKNWFPAKKTSVDHVIPVGQLNCAEDLPGFVNRLFCEVDRLQVLCENCHTIKTREERNGKSNNAIKKERMAKRTGNGGNSRKANSSSRRVRKGNGKNKRTSGKAK